MSAQPEHLHAALAATHEVETAIERLRSIKREQKALAKAAKEEEKIVKDYIGDDYTDLFDDASEELLATYRAQTALCFDTKAFAVAHPKLFKKFQVEKTTRKLLIK